MMSRLGAFIFLIATASVSARKFDVEECTTPNETRGSCILLDHCPSLKNMRQKQLLRDEDRQFLIRSQCGSVNRTVLVCCSDGNTSAVTQLSELNQRRSHPLIAPTTAVKDQVEYVSPYGECTTPNNEKGICIVFDQCPFLYNLIQKKPLLREDIDYLKRRQCGSDKQKILVCCTGEQMSVQQKLINERGILPEPGECGSLLSDRIVGGTATRIDEFPWTALIEYHNGSRTGHHCGGSLINNRYVMTAAHCIERISESWTPVSVRLGEWDITTNPDCLVDTRGYKDCAHPYVDVPIESITIHPDYVNNSRSQLNDIALIRLRSSISYSDFIKPICLPVRATLRYISLDGVVMDIAGWGRTENSQRSKKKLKAEVRGVSMRSCQRQYRRKGYSIYDTQICAGGKLGVDSCKGDSGGALIAVDSSNKSVMYYYAAGIISFGHINCGLEGWPGIYTRVSSYVDWIKDNILP